MEWLLVLIALLILAVVVPLIVMAASAFGLLALYVLEAVMESPERFKRGRKKNVE